jgi:zinc protease
MMKILFKTLPLGFAVLMCMTTISLSTPSFGAQQKIKNEMAADPAPQASAERKKVFDAESFTLDNGLQVIVIPNNRVPVVTQMLWHKVGAADEAYGHSGIAHFLEHLAFKGSELAGAAPLKPGEFSQIIRSMGGNDNAFTSHDYTAYFQSVPVDKLDMIMRMEAGRMNGVAPPLAEVESERKVVIEERKQRTENDPRAQFQEQMAARAFINHPYGKPVIGWAHEMAQMKWPEVKAFYDRWYAPNTSILIITGAVSPAEVFQKAIEFYGHLPREAIPERVRPQSPPFTSQTTIRMSHPAIREPIVQTLYRTPSARQNKTESLALQVLEEIMDGGPSSRLYKALVAEQKIATSIGLSYSGDAWDDASLWLFGTPAQKNTLEDVQAGLQAQLKLLAEKGVSEEELRDAKSRLIDQAAFARDSLIGPAMIIGQALATGLTLDDVEYWPYNIEAVTAADVQAVAAKYLNPAQQWMYPPVTGYLLPAAVTKEETR